MSIFIKSLKPRPFRVKGYRLTIMAALRAEGKIMKGMYLKTVKTWKKKPRFRVDARVRGEDARVMVSTSNEIFKYIDEGTSVRWAVMGQGFRSKTKVRTIGSSRGAGGPVIVGRRAMQSRNIRPRPGIKARLFSVEIRKRRRKFFFANMRKAMARAAKGSF